jgi:hypothetical protein
MDMDAWSMYGHLGESAEFTIDDPSVFRCITDTHVSLIPVCARIGVFMSLVTGL